MARLRHGSIASKGGAFKLEEPSGDAWKDSNVAGIGTDEDKALRKEAAQTEEAWAGAGQQVGIAVWRIEQFKVVKQKPEDAGSFYEGDSYIVLHTHKDDDAEKLEYDVYFWLGLESTTDERGTAAYKTVELDDLLDGAPVQHREVMLHESAGFKALFSKMVYLKGGVASGFHSVEDVTGYAPRLLHVHKEGRRTTVVEVTCERASLNSGDSFVLDCGTLIYTWSGDGASPFEKSLARMTAEGLESTRNGKSTATDEIDAAFWEALGGEGPVATKEDAEAVLPVPVEQGEGALFRLSDTSGEMAVLEVGRGELTPSMLDPSDVFICDPGNEVMVWVGPGASDRERRSAMSTVSKYLQFQDRPFTTPVTCFKDDAAAMRNPLWKSIFAN